VGLFWLYVGTRYPEHDWAYLGAVAYAAQLAIIGRASDGTLWRCAAAGWILPMLPYIALRGLDARTLELALAALPAVAAGLGVFAWGWRRLAADPYSMKRWLLQAGGSAVATLLALIPWTLLR